MRPPKNPDPKPKQGGKLEQMRLLREAQYAEMMEERKKRAKKEKPT